jgi:hypothetical protein
MVNKFGLAAVCWTIGRTKNFVCFQEKKIKYLAEIIFPGEA